MDLFKGAAVTWGLAAVTQAIFSSRSRHHEDELGRVPQQEVQDLLTQKQQVKCIKHFSVNA